MVSMVEIWMVSMVKISMVSMATEDLAMATSKMPLMERGER